MRWERVGAGAHAWEIIPTRLQVGLRQHTGAIPAQKNRCEGGSGTPFPKCVPKMTRSFKKHRENTGGIDHFRLRPSVSKTGVDASLPRVRIPPSPL